MAAIYNFADRAEAAQKYATDKAFDAANEAGKIAKDAAKDTGETLRSLGKSLLEYGSQDDPRYDLTGHFEAAAAAAQGTPPMESRIGQLEDRRHEDAGQRDVAVAVDVSMAGSTAAAAISDDADGQPNESSVGRHHEDVVGAVDFILETLEAEHGEKTPAAKPAATTTTTAAATSSTANAAPQDGIADGGVRNSGGFKYGGAGSGAFKFGGMSSSTNSSGTPSGCTGSGGGTNSGGMSSCGTGGGSGGTPSGGAGSGGGFKYGGTNTSGAPSNGTSMPATNVDNSSAAAVEVGASE